MELLLRYISNIIIIYHYLYFSPPTVGRITSEVLSSSLRKLGCEFDRDIRDGHNNGNSVVDTELGGDSSIIGCSSSSNSNNSSSVTDDSMAEVYICGPQSMIEHVEHELIELGLQESQIHYEKWW